MRIITDTSNYEHAHGKKPKGFGCWYFNAVVSDDQGSYSDLGTRFSTASYAQAKRDVLVQFKQEANNISRAKSLILFVQS